MSIISEHFKLHYYIGKLLRFHSVNVRDLGIVKCFSILFFNQLPKNVPQGVHWGGQYCDRSRGSINTMKAYIKE